MATRLVWHGPTVLAKVQRATADAIDDVTKRAAADASSNHWWTSRTGQLQAMIVNEPATRVGKRAKGRFGSTKGGGFYGLFLERKTPFLRPAADRTFPTLAAEIRKRIR